MINVVYLVLVFYSEGSYGKPITTLQIPQANGSQCEVNKKAILKDNSIYRAYCIVGVK